MAKETLPLDISNTPELVRLAEEVARTGTARLLRRNHESLAVLSPLRAPGPRRRRAKTEADLAAFRAAAGAWSDLDLDRFLEHIDASRRVDRPPAEL
jgi:hypothetical protein